LNSRTERGGLSHPSGGPHSKSMGRTMLGTILIILLILARVGAFPRWGYNRGWGYGPSGITGVLLIVVLVLALSGRI
jgi:hypothetical protein